MLALHQQTLSPGQRPRRSQLIPLLLPAAFAIAIGVTIATAAAPADAAPLGQRQPSVEEQRFFADGVRLMKAGDAVGAAKAFNAGYNVARDPAFLVRLGEAHEKAGAVPAALGSYKQYLLESPDAADHDDIESRVRRLSPSAGAETQPTGEPPPSSSPSSAPPSAVGADAATTPLPAAGAAPRPPAPVATTATALPASGHPSAQVDEEESLRAFADETAQPRSRLGTAAWIGAGVTVALLGVAAFYGAKASDKASDVDRLLRSFDQTTDIPVEYASVAAQYESDLREGKRDDRVAKGFAIAAGAAAVTTAALFVIDAVRGPAPAVERVHAAVLPMGTPQGAGMSIGWTF